MTEANDFVVATEKLNFVTRCINLQKDAITECDNELARIAEAKKQAAAVEMEDTANRFLCLECVVLCLQSQLQMWVYVKEDRMLKAWQCLVAAQNKASLACRAHEMGRHMERIAERLEVIEGLIFPPQIFQSAGMIIHKATCSICGAEYGDCDHLKGMPYMGEFCARMIEECIFTEVSMVDEPADKNCIVTSYSNDGKHWIDRMTLRKSDRPLDEDKSGTENGEEESQEG